MDQFPAGRSFVQAALDAVSRAGMASVDMRYFAARDGKPVDYCRQRVSECEIYVAVIGFRYGSIVPGEAVSYTELEFNEASAAGLPRLVFLLEKPASLPATLADADRGAVEAFRQRLRGAGLVFRAFTSAADLELGVFQALKELKEEAAGRAASDGAGGPAVAGLGELLFSARIKDPDGPLTVGFGGGESLVVTEKNAAVHRWSLKDKNELPGLPRGEMLRKAAGERFATHDRQRVAIRDFGDGSVCWQHPCPPNVAAVAIDRTGTAAAIASGPNLFGSSNRITIVTQDDSRPHEFSFENFPLFGAGCQLGMSGEGALVCCASFREVLLLRPRERQVVHRRRLGDWRQEVAPALGARPQRLICTPAGQVLWLRGRPHASRSSASRAR